MSIYPSQDRRDEWQSTRAETTVSTQIQAHDDESDPSQRDIGRPVGPTRREMFVSCDPAEAIQQQFNHLHPEYIALHDIATSSSRKLLAALASASGRAVQQLVVRRQGYGTPLATLEFIDLPVPAGQSALRLYTTEADADTHSRHEIARVLLCHSRLGVLMVGDLPPHLMASTFEPLREAMIKRDWHNRHLLVLPLAHSTTLASLGTELGRGTGVTVRTTPQVARLTDAWSFISGSWNRLREQAHTEAGLSLPLLPGATPVSAPVPLSALQASATPIAPKAMKPMPSLHPRDPHPEDGALGRYVHQLIELPGMVSVAIFDTASGQDLLHAGARPGGPELGHHGAALLSIMSQASRTLGMGHVLPEAAITLGTHHLVLRAVPHHPGLALHAVLDKAHANLTLARLQIGRMDTVLDTQE